MKLTASGISKFHFWGTYSQSFYLTFDSPESAALALPILRKLTLTEGGTNACGDPVHPSAWKQHESLCGVIASGGDIARIEAQLASFGADSEAIGSLAHSVDSGRPFEVCIHAEDPAQVLMTF